MAGYVNGRQLKSMCCPACHKPLSEHVGVDFADGKHVIVDSCAYELSPMQCDILQTLWERRARAQNPIDLLEAIYGTEADWPDTKCVTSQICYIRRKLAGSRLKIENIWGKGYRAVLA